MNADNLRELKELTKNLTVLFVEDSQVLQKQVSKFLSKLFKEVYQACDGEEGLEKFKKHRPNMVLTDLTMPKKNGLDMIREIMIINDKTKIIVISAHNDEEVISKIISLKVIDFLLKPLDMDKLIDKLLNVYGNKQNTSNKTCVKDLEMIYQHNGRVRFINYYKDILVQNDGKIVSIDEGKFVVKVPHIQALAIDYEKYIIIELKSVNKYMKLKLVEVDTQKDLVYLINPMYIDHTIKANKNKHYFLNRNSKMRLHINHKYFEFNIIDISLELVTLYTPLPDIELEVDDEINFTLVLCVNDSPGAKEIFAKGNVLKMGAYSGGYKIISTLFIEDEDKQEYEQYLNDIDSAILQELTQ
jgi:YesN/AraC family two-component response regulator